MKKTLITSLCIFSGLVGFAGKSPASLLRGYSAVQPITVQAINRPNRNAFKKGVQVMSLGYGIPNFGKRVFGDIDEIYPDADFGGIGPIYLRYEYAIADNWGLGLVTRFATSKVEYPVNGPLYNENQESIGGDSTYTYTQTFRSIGIMARGNYHFGTSRRWDHYFGVGIGYGNTNFKVDLGGNFNGVKFETTSPIPIALEATVGTRYYFSEKMGAYAELGFSEALLNGGFIYRF